MADYNTDPALNPTPVPTPEFLKSQRAPKTLSEYAPPRTPVDLGQIDRQLQQGVQGIDTRRPLTDLSRQITGLTFQMFMTMCSEIVEREGYKPPDTPYELAALINSWALAQGKP